MVLLKTRSSHILLSAPYLRPLNSLFQIPYSSSECTLSKPFLSVTVHEHTFKRFLYGLSSPLDWKPREEKNYATTLSLKLQDRSWPQKRINKNIPNEQMERLMKSNPTLGPISLRTSSLLALNQAQGIERWRQCTPAPPTPSEWEKGKREGRCLEEKT